MLEVIEQKNEGASTTASEYTLRPILFVVPRGHRQRHGRRAQREGRGHPRRFQNCDEGLALPFARAIKDVAVREPDHQKVQPICRSHFASCWPQTRVGRLSSPDVTPQGPAKVFALCEKKESKADSAGQA